jgi:hypothetical protein
VSSAKLTGALTTTAGVSAMPASGRTSSLINLAPGTTSNPSSASSSASTPDTPSSGLSGSAKIGNGPGVGVGRLVILALIGGHLVFQKTLH